MLERQGAGRVRHVEVAVLWVQRWVKDGGVAVRAEPTRTNCADLGTKVHSVARFRELFDIIRLRIVTISKQRPARRRFLCLFPLLELLIVCRRWQA